MPRLARAEGRDPRLLVIVLRGALDGLGAVAPVGDPDWIGLRGDRALALDGKPPALPLDSFFALNPAMPNLHRLWLQQQATIVHATAGPYREARSHFEMARTFWKAASRGRAPSIAAGPTGRWSSWHRTAGWICAAAAPLVLARSRRWWCAARPPSCRGSRKNCSQPAMTRRRGYLTSISTPTRSLRLRFRHGSGLQHWSHRRNGRAGDGRTSEYNARLRAMRRKPRAPRHASRQGGWSGGSEPRALSGGTPTSTVARPPVTANLLGALDVALAAIETAKGDAWRDTYRVVTEFGRTARINGTDGTDHGTGTVAFLVGGALRGGRRDRRLAGTETGAALEQRDLKPTTDLRAVLKGLLRDHLRVDERVLANTVFPESADVTPTPRSGRLTKEVTDEASSRYPAARHFRPGVVVRIR